MMLTLVSAGFGRSRTLRTVGIDRTAVVLGEGLMGVAGREWDRYQAKTTLGC